MNKIGNFLKTTIFGGLVFLVPAILLLLVLRHALELSTRIAHPIVARFPDLGVDHALLATAIAALVLVALAFLAGLAARTAPGGRLTRWFEESILGGLPQYRMVKSLADGFAQVESGDSAMQPALVLIDDGWQIAYRLEDLRDGWVTVFVPQSPTPMSGNVMFVESARVRPLPISMKDAVLLVKRLGSGAAQVLEGVRFEVGVTGSGSDSSKGA